MKQRQHSRGETSIQSVLLIPVVFSLYFLCAHVTAIFHAAQVAQLAAEQGAQLASTAGTFTTDIAPALNRIESVVSDLGSQLASAPQIEESLFAVKTTVSVRVPGIVPFLPASVSRSTHVPRERFLMEQER